MIPPWLVVGSCNRSYNRIPAASDKQKTKTKKMVPPLEICDKIAGEGEAPPINGSLPCLQCGALYVVISPKQRGTMKR